MSFNGSRWYLRHRRKCSWQWKLQDGDHDDSKNLKLNIMWLLISLKSKTVKNITFFAKKNCN